MTRQDDMAAAAFVTGAMLASHATLTADGEIVHDPCVVTFTVPGMGRVRVHVEAVHTPNREATRGNDREA